MSKNNQGYFLVETIIVLAIVATIITTLYVNSGQTYIKHKNELTKYNTVDGLYSANAVKKYLYTYEEDLKKDAKENGYTNVNSYFKQFVYGSLLILMIIVNTWSEIKKGK